MPLPDGVNIQGFRTSHAQGRLGLGLLGPRQCVDEAKATKDEIVTTHSSGPRLLNHAAFVVLVVLTRVKLTPLGAKSAFKTSIWAEICSSGMLPPSKVSFWEITRTAWVQSMSSGFSREGGDPLHTRGITTFSVFDAANLLEALSFLKRLSALATLSGEMTVPQVLGTNGVGDSTGKGR